MPAQINWTQNDVHCGLSVETDYPYATQVVMTLQLPSPQLFTLNLRVPAWAQDAALLINGKRQALRTGQFAAIRREWHPADRVELELPDTRRLESVDAAHPDTVALLAGPLVLMRLIETDSAASPIRRDSLLRAQRDSDGRHEWQVTTGAGTVKLKPFLDIDGELYSAYQSVQQS